jgi:hypothetical protein
MKRSTLVILVTSAMLVTACSPQRRLERLLAHHPELTACDTARIIDTLITPSVVADTLLLWNNLPDTVIIQKEKLHMELVRLHDTLLLSGSCQSDTIIRTLQVPVEKIRLVKPDKAALLIGKIPWIVAGVIVVSLLIVFLVLKRKLLD